MAKSKKSSVNHRQITGTVPQECFRRIVRMQMQQQLETASKPTYGQIMSQMTAFLFSHYENPGVVIMRGSATPEDKTPKKAPRKAESGMSLSPQVANGLPVMGD